MKYLTWLLLIGCYASLNAQDLAVSAISKELSGSANVVVRKSDLEFNVLDEGKAIETYTVTLTVLNKAGSHVVTQKVPYSNLEKILMVEGAIYDYTGKKVKTIKKSDFKDVSATNSSMYSDNRLLVLDFSYPSFPYTIYFKYKVEHHGLMFYPSWFPQNSNTTAIEKASFQVTVPQSIGLNHYEHRLSVDKSTENGLLIYNWQLQNVPGFRYEPLGPPMRNLVPYVLITPKVFKMDGYQGSMSSWKSIGDWSRLLAEGRGELPAEVKAEIDQIISGVADKREVARLIYQYMQNTTRYVSIQLGIGGWQPYDANYVYKNGYGDCKALTNYTASLLRHAGIESFYTLVRAGNNVPDIIVDFPNGYFNHAFLTVPLESDTLWLECTNQKNPFGYLGSFTSDRHVLMVTPGGGKLIKTPAYGIVDNQVERKVAVTLDRNGYAQIKVSTHYSGLAYEKISHQVDATTSEQKKWLTKNLGLSKPLLQSVYYELTPGKVPKVVEEIKLSSPGFTTVSGKRIFLTANPLIEQLEIPREIKNRQSEVYIRNAFVETDSIHFILPEGYHVEYLPEETHIKTVFGEYLAVYSLTENGLLYTRKRIQKKGTFPPQDYQVLRTMLKEIKKADNSKVVLVGST